MRIGLASNDWAVRALDADGRPTWGGSGWARLGLPGRHLARLGLDVVEGTVVFDKRRGRFLVRTWPVFGQDENDPDLMVDVDLIVLQRWMFASIAVEAPTAIANGQAVVNDLDDHFWALDPRNQASWASDPRRNPVENRSHYRDVLRASSAVTVSTPYLADVAKKDLGVRVPIHVIPNHVDLDRFARVYEENRLRVAVSRGGFLSETRPTLGWVGATPWRSGDVETLAGVLGPFMAQHRLTGYHGGHLEGAATYQDQADLQGHRVITKAMVPIDQYPTLFDGLGIGVVPLRDVPFNRAKSWIKGLEYAAAGVPFVAQDLPEYVRLVARGIGRVAKRPKDWTRQMAALLPPEARLEEIESNHRAAKSLDIRQGVGLWKDLYLDLLAKI